MKIGIFTPDANGNVEDKQIFVPTRIILVRLVTTNAAIMDQAWFDSLQGTVNVVLVNSQTGEQTTIVPSLPIGQLAEIATLQRGVIMQDSNSIYLPILLNPDYTLSISNDKFLKLDIRGLSIAGEVPTKCELYSSNNGNISDYVAVYNKMTAPQGVSRHWANCANAEVLVLSPSAAFDSIQIIYKNGMTNELTPAEFRAEQALQNELACVYHYGDQDVFAPVYRYAFCLNIEQVEKIQIIRDTNSSSSFDFVLIDTKKS